VINKLKERESGLRERYEGEIKGQYEKIKKLNLELDDTKVRYDRLKQKLQEKNLELEKDLKGTEKDLESEKMKKEQQLGEMKRINEK